MAFSSPPSAFTEGVPIVEPRPIILWTQSQSREYVAQARKDLATANVKKVYARDPERLSAVEVCVEAYYDVALSPKALARVQEFYPDAKPYGEAVEKPAPAKKRGK